MNNNVNFNGFIDLYQENDSQEPVAVATTIHTHIAPPYRPGVLFDSTPESEIDTGE